MSQEITDTLRDRPADSTINGDSNDQSKTRLPREGIASVEHLRSAYLSSVFSPAKPLYRRAALFDSETL